MILFPVLRLHQRGETGFIVALVSFARVEIGIDDHIHVLSYWIAPEHCLMRSVYQIGADQRGYFV